ncbi:MULTISPECIES: FMN-dependent NADH-azoreductase [unclassified Bradyrhizobium]|uniref:FMN-dependent NADH-azoreductase n=1 Tax=unclassified Bradyrhizobium TaxID=2631580 RepID=UPI002916E602|nr:MULTISPECIES: FMN-dependent NADH-azoreductase [unclassified Bradyrhizobium]
MTLLLHIDSSVLGPNSVSRQVSAAIVARLRQITPGLEVTYRDVAAEPLSHLSGTHVAVAYGAPVEDPAVKADVAAGQAVLEEFLAADIVVIGAPMYNFSIPSQLKAWVDRIAVRGKTFTYGPNGPQGLAGGKRIIVAVSRGGHYGADTPMAAFEHLETYLRSVFSFIGVTDLEFVAADGVQIGPEHREQALAKAIQTAGGLAA